SSGAAAATAPGRVSRCGASSPPSGTGKGRRPPPRPRRGCGSERGAPAARPGGERRPARRGGRELWPGAEWRWRRLRLSSILTTSVVTMADLEPLTPTQLEILQAVWELGDHGGTAPEIWQQAARLRELARTTVLTQLQRLHRKGWL